MPDPSDARPVSGSDDPGTVALRVAGHLRRLDPGALAALRRDGGGPGFWRLAARNPLLGARPDRWRVVVQGLALLTAKGAPEDRPDLQDAERPLGMALCDGGDPAWPGQGGRPMLSERRLAQLLAARGTQRDVAILRVLRMLAASKPRAVGLRVPDIAWAVLDPGNADAIAAPYYRRLDRAEAEPTAEPNEDASDA